MGTYDQLQRKPSSSSTRKAPTSRRLRPSRSLAPAPAPTSGHVSADKQTQPRQDSRVRYSLADIPLLPPERENQTGLPDNLKAGIESFSGMAIDDVNVHYNSTQPSHLQMQHISSPALPHNIAYPTSLPASSTTSVYAGHDFSRIFVNDHNKRGSRSSYASPDSLGNNYQVIQQRIPFSATIQRVDSGPSTKKRLDNQQLFQPTSVPMAHLDAGPGRKSRVGGPLSEAMRYQPRTNIPEPEEGQTVHLPDITYPGLAKISQTDNPLSSRLTYKGTITQKNDEPKQKVFGITTTLDISLEEIEVTSTDSRFEVNATLNHPIWFQVRKTKGPEGQVDISSPESPNITQNHYQLIAEDLTPKDTDEGGRPPRKYFWAEDITIIHERFHAEEAKKFAAEGTQRVQKSLNEQKASDVKEVEIKVRKGVESVIKWTDFHTRPPDCEKRAYGDGKHLYKDRVEAITRKGEAEQYPKKEM